MKKVAIDSLEGFHLGNRESIPLWTTTPFREVGHITLLGAYTQHIKHLEGFLHLDYAYNTLRAYKSSLSSLKRYMNSCDVTLTELNLSFIEGYYHYQRTVDKLLPNSAFKNIKNLYRVIHVCIEKGYLLDNPFKRFPCRYKNPIRPYLTESEVETLLNTNFKRPGLSQVRDVFLFQVYTGLAYADIKDFSRNNIEVGIDGNEWLVIMRQKTGIRSALPLLPRAKAILQKYDYTLPVISNQKMNEHLKDIATICKITKKLTTHIGRHTFATTITLSKGIPIETVSKILGHSSLQTTMIYAQVVDAKVANDFKLLLTQ